MKWVGHHRKPGRNALERIATLCRACHSPIHHRKRLSYGLSPMLKRFWRELHPDQPEQLELPFLAADEERVQASLFAAA